MRAQQQVIRRVVQPRKQRCEHGLRKIHTFTMSLQLVLAERGRASQSERSPTVVNQHHRKFRAAGRGGGGGGARNVADISTERVGIVRRPPVEAAASGAAGAESGQRSPAPRPLPTHRPETPSAARPSSCSAPFERRGELRNKRKYSVGGIGAAGTTGLAIGATTRTQNTGRGGRETMDTPAGARVLAHD